MLSFFVICYSCILFVLKYIKSKSKSNLLTWWPPPHSCCLSPPLSSLHLPLIKTVALALVIVSGILLISASWWTGRGLMIESWLPTWGGSRLPSSKEFPQTSLTTNMGSLSTCLFIFILASQICNTPRESIQRIIILLQDKWKIQINFKDIILGIWWQFTSLHLVILIQSLNIFVLASTQNVAIWFDQHYMISIYLLKLPCLDRIRQFSMLGCYPHRSFPFRVLFLK